MQWIKCSERLPEERLPEDGPRQILFLHDGLAWTGEFYKKSKQNVFVFKEDINGIEFSLDEITHWMQVFPPEKS
jgi:hypothetical protein